MDTRGPSTKLIHHLVVERAARKTGDNRAPGKQHGNGNPRQERTPEAVSSRPLLGPYAAAAAMHRQGTAVAVPCRLSLCRAAPERPVAQDRLLSDFPPPLRGWSRAGDAWKPAPGSHAAASVAYLAAVTMISTRNAGRARSARTQARAGGFCGSTQAFHTALCASNNCISASQT
jgi:hypothetical protein